MDKSAIDRLTAALERLEQQAERLADYFYQNGSIIDIMLTQVEAGKENSQILRQLERDLQVLRHQSAQEVSDASN